MIYGLTARRITDSATIPFAETILQVDVSQQDNRFLFHCQTVHGRHVQDERFITLPIPFENGPVLFEPRYELYETVDDRSPIPFLIIDTEQQQVQASEFLSNPAKQGCYRVMTVIINGLREGKL